MNFRDQGSELRQFKTNKDWENHCEPKDQDFFANRTIQERSKKILKQGESKFSVIEVMADHLPISKPSIGRHLGQTPRKSHTNLETPSAILDAVGLKYELKYKDAIQLLVKVRKIPVAIDAIDYAEAKNFLKSLGGYFLKSVVRNTHVLKSFADNDCLTSLKVWNALFDPSLRDKINQKTKKISRFIQEIRGLERVITLADWVGNFTSFMLEFDAQEFRKSGNIKGANRILLYETLNLLLKAGAERFLWISNELKNLGIKINSFSFDEIYKMKMVFSFKTDSPLGDDKLVQLLRQVIKGRKELNPTRSKPSVFQNKNNEDIKDMASQSEISLQAAGNKLPSLNDGSGLVDKPQDEIIEDPDSVPLNISQSEFREKFRAFVIHSNVVYLDSRRSTFLNDS